MPGRLTAFLATLLATLAVALAPFAGAATVAAAAGAERSSSCCGDACSCGDACPCAAERDENEPTNGDAPAAPTERNERRTFGCPPTVVRSLALGCELAPERPLDAGDREAPSRHAGRALLSRISKWTT